MFFSNGIHMRIIKDMSALRVISDSGSVCSLWTTVVERWSENPRAR